jgi:hypothetical protein
MGLRGYFAARPWLIRWIVIFALALVVLALTGQIHTQGNGRPTPYELSIVALVVLIWVVAKAGFATDLTEEYLLGFIFGVQWEFLTEPYWNYLPDRFNILVWQGKDIPLLGLFGWGMVFPMALLLSNAVGRWLWSLTPKELLFDWRVLLADAIAIQVVGTGAEWLWGIALHCWDYAVDFGIGKSPLGLGWEIHIGYVIVMFWFGTTFRVWKLKLEGEL